MPVLLLVAIPAMLPARVPVRNTVIPAVIRNVDQTVQHPVNSIVQVDVKSIVTAPVCPGATHPARTPRGSGLIRGVINMIDSRPMFDGMSVSFHVTEECNLRCRYCYEVNWKGS